MTPRLRIAWTFVLIVGAAGAWCGAFVSWVMCAFSIALGPLVFAIFPFSAAVTSGAYALTVVAADSAIDCFTKEKDCTT